MWQAGDWSLRRSLTAIAAVIAGITIAAISLLYLWTAYQYEQERIGNRARLAATEISKLVYARPDTWMYQEERLSELLTSTTPSTNHETWAQHLQILSKDDAPVSEVGRLLSFPTITARHPITDGFTVVGMVELTESVRHIWLRGIPVGLTGLGLAIAIFMVLRVLPLRALLKREAALEAAQQENKKSEMQLQLVSDAMPVLIGYVDADERVRVMNKIGEDWYARPRAELIGRSIRDMLPGQLFGQLDQHVAAALSGKSVNFEHAAIYPDGIARQVRGRYIPHVAPNGQVQGYFALVEDVTAQRETEEQLRQAQKTEALGQLTGGIAHDFNNLLGIILGNIEILHDHQAEDPESRTLVEGAINACVRGGELTQRLLAFSRKQVLAPRVVSTNGLIANTALLLRRTIPSSIHIETMLAEDLWPAMVDAGQLENAIVNLSINARDAMPAGGKLTIETANMEIGLDTADDSADELAAGSYVTVTVSDSGTGMPSDVVARVFEPFFTTKEVGKGSGLGLSMVYGFAKQSGGQVKIYSEVGGGTSVRLYLPKANSDVVSLTPDRPRDLDLPAGRGETILVVEDAEDLRHIAIAHLQNLGYTVLQAGEGPTALAMLQERPDIDLLFTDVILPDGMDGGELARQAKARQPNLKVLFASGYSRNALVHQGRLEEGVHLIDKPYRRRDLARGVRAALDKPTLERTSA